MGELEDAVSQAGNQFAMDFDNGWDRGLPQVKWTLSASTAVSLVLADRLDKRLSAIEETLAAAGHPVAGRDVSEIRQLQAEVAALSDKRDKKKSKKSRKKS